MKHLVFVVWILLIVFLINTIVSAQKQTCKTGMIYLDKTKTEQFVKGFKNER